MRSEAHGGVGQRVGVWLPSRIESVVALLACSKSGAVCCPSLHRDHTTGEVTELMQRTRAVAFIWQTGYGADADKRDLIDALKAVSTLRHVYQLKPLAETDTAPFAELAPAKNDGTAAGRHAGAGLQIGFHLATGPLHGG